MTPETLLNEPDGILTVAEAAELLGCNPETVRRAIRARRLPAHRPLGARGWHIKRADLAQLVQVAA